VLFARYLASIYFSLLLEQMISMPRLIYGMKILAQDVRAVIVPNSGHWITEEQPEFVIKQLVNFLAGSCTTKMSK
jgi:pimeloyl-ACP methyl ester carboxylesterase